MSVSDVSSSARRHVVAVGPTREDAATPFGLDHSHMFLTSYADLSAEVDLDDVDSVDLAAGAGLYPALDLVCRRLDPESDFSLRIEYTLGTGEALADALERNGAAIAEVQTLAGSLLLVLESSSRTSDPRTRTILSGVDAGASASPAGEQVPAGHLEDGAAGPAETAGAASAKAPAAPTATGGASARPKRPRPRLLSRLDTVNRWRDSPRRRAALLAGLVVLAVVLLVVGLVSGSTVPVVVILLVVLVLAVLAATFLLFLTMLVLARQVHAQTGRIERMVLRNRAILQQRAAAIERRVGEISQEQRRLPFMFDYLEAVAAANSTFATRVTDQIQSLEGSAAALHLDTQRQVQALLDLHRLVEIDHRLPSMGAGAASAEFEVLMLRELISIRPHTVVECGSGTTTLLLALAVKQYGLSTRVVALEHLETGKTLTERALREHGVAEFAEVRLAPFSPVSLPEITTPWYTEDAWTDLDEIGLLVVAGPPTTTGDQVRPPTVPLLRDRLSARCTIMVDDLTCWTDAELAQSWGSLLPDFTFEPLDMGQKHAGVFRRRTTGN